MQIRELSIPDSYEITPIQRRDDRGVFLEWYRHDHRVGNDRIGLVHLVQRDTAKLQPSGKIKSK